MVPTQFHRLLLLPDEVRQRYDVSSLRNVMHAAAPCPIDVKRKMFAWWGNVIYEYYGATEGGGAVAKPDDWLANPGIEGTDRYTMFGYYDDRLVRTDAGWKIAEMQLNVTRTEGNRWVMDEAQRRARAKRDAPR